MNVGVNKDLVFINLTSLKIIIFYLMSIICLFNKKNQFHKFILNIKNLRHIGHRDSLFISFVVHFLQNIWVQYKILRSSVSSIHIGHSHILVNSVCVSTDLFSTNLCAVLINILGDEFSDMLVGLLSTRIPMLTWQDLSCFNASLCAICYIFVDF